MARRTCIGDYFSLQRGRTYKSRLLGQPGPVLLGLASIARDGGFRGDSLKTYGGDCPPEMILRPGELYVSLKDVTQSGDLLGSVARVPANIPLGRLTQDTVKLVPRSDDVPLDYMYWLLRTPQYRTHCRSHATGTTNLGLPRDDFLSFPVPEPTADQIAFVKILGGLDDKIELNRRMNRTLEGIARAIFKSWFVDFDPVRAKAEGRDPGLPRPITELFPDSFQQSELGEIPKGWEVRRVDEVCEFAYGKALKADDRVHGTFPVFGSNGQVGWHNKSLVQGPGIVIGRKGNPGTVKWVDCDFFPIDTTFYVVSPSMPLSYLCFALEWLDLPRLSADSAVPGLNRGSAYIQQLIEPPADLLNTFDSHIMCLRKRIAVGAQQAQTIAAIRDALLPKLISGEIRIKDAERIVGRVA